MSFCVKYWNRGAPNPDTASPSAAIPCSHPAQLHSGAGWVNAPKASRSASSAANAVLASGGVVLQSGLGGCGLEEFALDGHFIFVRRRLRTVGSHTKSETSL